MQDYSGVNLGPYQIIRPLGKGGMAAVYLALQTRLERNVAIKFISNDTTDPDRAVMMLRRFDREAKTLAKLSHPNIVKVIDSGSYLNTPYIVMEYVAGGTLLAWTGRPMPYPRAARLLLPIARALAYAHGAGIIHRDIKPGNILISPNGDPMLSDFGIAKILDAPQQETSLTGMNTGIGTPEYMAPEQWLNKISAQTDMYALGVVFYELITGRKPFQADTPAGILIKQSNEAPPRPISIISNLPGQVEDLILKALAKKPEDRFASMSVFADELERLIQGAPTSGPHSPLAVETPTVYGDRVNAIQEKTTLDQAAPPRGRQSTTLQALSKNKTGLWLLGGGTVGLCLGGIVLLSILSVVWFNRQPTPAPTPQAGGGPPAAASPARVIPSATQTIEKGGGVIANPGHTPAPTQLTLPTDTAMPSPTHAPILPTQASAPPAPAAPAAAALSDVSIAFSSGVVNNSDIGFGRGSGGSLSCIACDAGSDETDPSVSADNSMVVFSANYNGSYDIYRVSTQGGKAAALTNSTDQDESEADISHDGSKIVFKVNSKGGAKSEGEFYTMNADGSSQQPLGIQGRAPTWSPDGRKIAYMAREGNLPWQIYVYSLDSRQTQKLTSCDNNCRFPDWSPDMQNITFNLTTSANPASTNPAGIAFIPVSGGAMVTLVSKENAGRPTWSAAGWIAFNSDNGIEMIKPDGSGRHILFQGNYWGASWSQ